MAAQLIRRAACAVFFAVLALTEAQAMRPPEDYRAARAAAAYWLQLRILSVRQAAVLPGDCLVRTEVLRSFRGQAPVAREIDLEVECQKRGQRGPPGDEFRIDADELRPGRVVEAFVDAAGGRYRVALRQIDFVAQPGERPSFTGKE